VLLKFGGELMADLQAGNVDAINLENPIAVQLLKDDSRFDIYYESWDDISTMLSLIWNHRNPLFHDARVRRAMAHAIDRHELLNILDMWEALPVVDVPFTEPQYWNDQLPEPLPYDPVLARRLLDEAGWHDTDGNGTRERNGAEFRFPLIVSQRYQSIAVYVQHMLQEVGVAVEITTLDGGAVWERTYESGDFAVSLYYVWISPDDPDMGLEVMMGENSKIGFHNPRAIELVNAAMGATNPLTLDSIYRELAPIVQEEQPFTFLVFGVEAYAVQRRVKGLSSPFRANPLWAAAHLRIEDESEDR
jgi:peptide/nickel transport system substrate-binding protein